LLPEFQQAYAISLLPKLTKSGKTVAQKNCILPMHVTIHYLVEEFSHLSGVEDFHGSFTRKPICQIQMLIEAIAELKKELYCMAVAYKNTFTSLVRQID
jgi:hypothetical protein